MQDGLEFFNNFYELVDEVLPLNFEIIKAVELILEKENANNSSSRDCMYFPTMRYYNISYLARFDKHFERFKKINCYNKF